MLIFFSAVLTAIEVQTENCYWIVDFHVNILQLSYKYVQV